MKISVLFTLPLAAALVLPAAAQQASSDNQQPAASSSQSSSQTADSSSQSTQSAQNANSDQNLSARQPLQPETREGFWGRVNPFARKKYVQRQLTPVRDRINELDDLTAENARQIKDVDARAQEGIRQADAKATLADQHATDAGNRAQQANQTATQASARLNTVEQVVGNIDQYQTATQTEIRFRPTQTVLSSRDKEAIDNMTAGLKEEKGYIIEVQGFSTGAGQAGVQRSQAMADAVVRYLVEKNEIPVYRVFVMGMGNARVPAEDGSTTRARNRVEISVLKNNVSQLASATQPSGYSTQPNSTANQMPQQSGYASSSSSTSPQQ
jgi:flagellar motor protein MotB